MCIIFALALMTSPALTLAVALRKPVRVEA